MPPDVARKEERPALAMVPVANPGVRFWKQGRVLRDTVQRVMLSGRYVLGPEVEAFEEEFARYVGVDHAVGVASGTDAVTIALRAGGVSTGDEVITVSHSAVATAAAIELAGGVPIFVDIDPASGCMDPDALADAVTSHTQAIVVVHTYGQPADMEAICRVAERHDLFVVEDCAQAHGARIGGRHVGSFGHIGAFSFYPTKNLGAMGDGGAVVTRDSGLADRVRRIRQYGWQPRGVAQESGMNSRLDELQAAILRIGLTTLEDDVQRRREIAGAYDAALAGTDVASPTRIENTDHAMHLYVVQTSEPDALASALSAHGVQTAKHYPRAIHQQPAYAAATHRPRELPHTENLYRRILTIPLYPELTSAQVSRVCRALTAAAKGG